MTRAVKARAAFGLCILHFALCIVCAPLEELPVGRIL